ncbi:hypothetical protein ACFPZ0_13140 [Streptomonospora nanhaiensis]|uniref:Uncharacterized protein n=1 Tax=Streptomonospora nanhaiensis TaxID=1323731 RepID=A0A853BH63_9ACTN|nr:hypothetical protein [Streptomonospora nanhaiensis]MBV2362520.1 hypothetical protein [Streptomonospora nanhaiensis]MBX9389318.1 hypothetical protein [Streptomonospora nanhaiensis]NYI94818.1 hypothetical protein [Streptomonospora nanhaiensis]
MGTRRTWIERKARQFLNGRGGAPTARSPRPHRTGGVAPTRGFGGMSRRRRPTYGAGPRPARRVGGRPGGGLPPEMSRGIRQIESRLRRMLRRH